MFKISFFSLTILLSPEIAATPATLKAAEEPKPTPYGISSLKYK